MREIGLNKRATELRKQLGPKLRKRTRTSQSAGSGLARASKIRELLAPELSVSSSSAIRGISPDDQREIERQIDAVSRRSKLSIRSEDFIVKPQRKGFVFPLVVNVLALLVTAAVVLFLSQLFHQRDLEIASSASSLETAEGKLLRELKREAETKLLEKDKAIADFQSKLIQLDKERAALAANINERVSSREAQLRAALKSEIEAERARLAAESMSDAAREARLKNYENQKNAELDRQIAAARKEAEAEKAAAENRFNQLKEEYQKSIASLSDERKKLQDETKRREAEIRAETEASIRALAAQGAETQAKLESARSQLAALEEQKNRRAVVEDQIIGLYDGIRSALRERRFEAAVTSANALVSYLNDPAVVSDQSLKARRDTDLFVAETLGIYARNELARATIDTTKLLEQASILAAAREASLAAQNALKSGDTATAQARYAEALAKVPEILAAHSYFIERSQAEEETRKARLMENLDAADRAFKSKDFSLMLSRYSSALEYLPVTSNEKQKLISQIGRAAAAEVEASAAADATARTTAQTALAEEQTKAARPLAMEASRRLSTKEWAQAIAAYTELISRYPRADQVETALSGIRAASAEMASSAEAERTKTKEAIHAEIERAEEARARADAALAELAQARLSESKLKADIENLKRQLSEAQEKTASAAASSSAGSSAVEAARAGKIIELEAEVKRLSTIASRYEEIVANYKSYRDFESLNLSTDTEALVAASAKLDTFLDSEAVRQTLPGLRDSIARYREAYIRSGQREVLYNALDILEGALRLRDDTARQRYFKDLESRFEGDSGMLAFIEGLRKNIK